jgi:hypothetical protein
LARARPPARPSETAAGFFSGISIGDILHLSGKMKGKTA